MQVDNLERTSPLGLVVSRTVCMVCCHIRALSICAPDRTGDPPAAMLLRKAEAANHIERLEERVKVPGITFYSKD